MKRTPSHSPRHAKPLLRLCLYLLLSPSLRSQDIHFSQIDINPVALNPAYNGFFGCRHFSKTNEILTAQGLQPIDWSK